MGESPSQITFVLRLFCGSLFVYIGLCGHFGRTSAPRSRRQIVLQQKVCRFCVVYFGRKKWSIRRDIVRFQPRRFFLCRALSHLKDLIFKFFRLACERRGSFISRTSLLHIKDRPQKSNWGRNGRQQAVANPNLVVATIKLYMSSYHGVATIRRRLKIIGLLCRMQFILQDCFAKETCKFKEPSNPFDQKVVLSRVFWMIRIGTFCMKTHFLENQKS